MAEAEAMAEGTMAPARLGFWPTPHGFSKDGRSNGPSGNELGRAVNQVERAFPTPTVAAAKGSSPKSLTRRDGRSRVNDRLDHRVMADHGGSLNPTWVEWLMGWPLGWTDLNASATARFQRWLGSHGQNCTEAGEGTERK
jgi:DNA (cytosine-5)-methyltransferase 1